MSEENNSSCLVQSQWDFANLATSKKFGSPFQAYRPQRVTLSTGTYIKEDILDRAVVTSKNKLRGRGKALSLLFSTEEGKDCHIYGWGLKVNSNDNI